MKSDYESEELLSGEDTSEDEGGHAKIRKVYYKPAHRPENIRFEKGMFFSSLAQFKMAVTEYAVHGGYAIKFKKNDKERVRAVCEAHCPWVILCAKLDGQLTYQLKTVNLEHKCTRTYKNPRLSSKFLASKLVNKVKQQPNIKLTQIQEKVHGKYVLHISRSKAYRAKRVAMDQVEGSHKDQYAALWDYCHELRRSNPGTTVKLMVKGYKEGEVRGEQPGKDIQPTFQRLYICFEACKRGFQSCRPVIGIDGCHLKGPYGGILLAAVGRDPNKEYFPIAFAVVEAENKDSWSWFISLLLEDLGNERIYTWTSDQQKGLDTTLKELQPGCEHRFCCRHLYNNFRKKHPGLLIREHFWKAAYATYPRHFERIMAELKTIDSEAVQWYVSDWYKVETYKSCYAPLIYPTNDPNMWTSPQHVDIL
ncbi:hypothetical protein Vadar_027631 [Vaccinium darrowii]|uniref:Uncharacterized protein n=1 Tax=Vaccinium darrowii TaxID=229202 RepID=A0ACB7Z6P1_9ERIC|nr:hypothetical protein Vadar_027631 [Vaccinium darrowii]